jgi:uncharacterized membrane protein
MSANCNARSWRYRRLMLALLLVAGLAACRRERPPRVVVFTALGTEPFWNVEVASDVVRLRRPNAPDVVVPAIAPQWLRAPGDTSRVLDSVATPRLWRSRRSSNDPVLELLVTPGSCSDGMSDRTYPFTARMVYGALTLTGCAMPGRPTGEAGPVPR